VLEQRALARAVVADDAERLAALDGKVDVLERPEFRLAELAALHRAAGERRHQVAQRRVELAFLELLVQAPRLENDVRHHTLSANFGSRRWKIAGVTINS